MLFAVMPRVSRSVKATDSTETHRERWMDILWVENHAHFARLAARQFLAGHAVTVVPSLAAARAALARRAFSVVLVDFDLDDGKGDELVRELRSLPARPWVVATSSHEAGNRALVEAGADAVCGKMEFGRIAEVLGRLGAMEKNDG
jgi:CheY-like chemotaxis protein